MESWGWPRPLGCQGATPLPELHPVPGDDGVGVEEVSGDFVLNKGKDPEGRGRFGKEMRGTVALNVGGNER